MSGFARLSLLLSFFTCARANYVTLTDRYTADPAPFVFEGRVYIYTSHDFADQHGWLMTDYSLMSSDDLQNWRDEGIVFDLKNQSWGEYAWAQQVIEGTDGLFYMYYPAMQARPGDKRSGTGVASSASVTGPFNDALGHPLLPCGDDPTVFRDDDGTVYLCGNCDGGALCAQLAPNMTALVTTPVLVKLPQWFEAPWLSKWNGVYYLSYMCSGDPGHGLGPFNHFGWDICYGSCEGPACSPLGPYTFRGSLMWSPPGNCGQEQGSSGNCTLQNSTSGDNNHQGIFEFPANSGDLYFAYHSRTLAYSRNAYHGFQRNVALDRLYARGDAGVYPLPSGLAWVVNDTAPGAGAGLLPVSSTPRWVRQLKFVDPYARVPATLSAAMSDGLDTEACSEGGRNLGFISNGAMLSLAGVDFGAAPGATSMTLRTATPVSGCTVTMLIDGAPAGAACVIPNTGDWQLFTNVTCPLFAGSAMGVAKNVSFVFNGPGTTGLLNLLYWTVNGGVVSGDVPPSVKVSVSLRSVATGLFACAADDAGAVVTPSGDGPCAWTLVDLEDGTWALSAGSSGKFACINGANGSLAATADAAGDACTRFWLYGTPVGSYALLSAGAGSFLTATSNPAAPISAGSADPRQTTDDGARFFVEEL